MRNKPRVLLTNDDGIGAPGLRHLWNSLKDFCELFIVAPSIEKSGAGLSVTLREPLHITPVVWEGGTPAWHVSGTPADCVRMAMSVLLDQCPDLVVSGINKGSNAGRNLLYSGTVGGVIEAAMRNIPGIAFSCQEFDEPLYANYEPYVFPLVQYLLENPLPNGSLLNVSFPEAKDVLGVKMARQGKGYHKESPRKGIHPEGRSYYWMGGAWDSHQEDIESDVYLLEQGYVTAVPIHVHELTDQHAFYARKDSFKIRRLEDLKELEV